LQGSLKTSNAPRDLFGLSLTEFNRDFAINTVSPYVAAQQAVHAFEKLPEPASRTFIYTGNILNTTTIPGFLF
jgi:hypothetical protein